MVGCPTPNSASGALPVNRAPTTTPRPIKSKQEKKPDHNQRECLALSQQASTAPSAGESFNLFRPALGAPSPMYPQANGGPCRRIDSCCDAMRCHGGTAAAGGEEENVVLPLRSKARPPTEGRSLGSTGRALAPSFSQTCVPCVPQLEHQNSGIEIFWSTGMNTNLSRETAVTAATRLRVWH